MCICLNCDRIISCSLYNLISKKHNESQFLFSFEFMPQSPIVQILLNSFKNRLFLEWDVNECLSFEDNPGGWLRVGSFNKYHFQHSFYLQYDIIFCNDIKI